MGFGTRGYQKPAANDDAKRAVKGACHGTTGNKDCTSAQLIGSTKIRSTSSSTWSIKSMELVVNSGSPSTYPGSSPIYYNLLFANNKFTGYGHTTITLTNTTTNNTATFPLELNYTQTSGNYYSAFTASSSPITTQSTFSSETGFTINPGTYSITISGINISLSNWIFGTTSTTGTQSITQAP